MLNKAEKQEMRQLIHQNKHEIFVLSLDEMDKVIKARVKSKHLSQQWEQYKNKAEFSANYFSSGKDTFLLAKLIADLGYAGTRVYVRYYGGKPHIILKGYPGLRKILNAPKYGVINPKVVSMGLGKYGAINAAKTGGILTLILLSAYRVIDYILTDSATLNQLIGSLAVDVVKVGITTGTSMIAGIAVASVVTAAIGPLVAVIIVGIAMTVGLTYIDKKYQITEKVIAGLDEVTESVQVVLDKKKKELIRAGREIIDDATDTVFDYAVESAQKIIINMFNHVYRKMTVPQI